MAKSQPKLTWVRTVQAGIVVYFANTPAPVRGLDYLNVWQSDVGEWCGMGKREAAREGHPLLDAQGFEVCGRTHHEVKRRLQAMVDLDMRFVCERRPIMGRMQTVFRAEAV